MEGLCFDSSKNWIWELESQERISSDQEAVRENANRGGDKKHPKETFCGADRGMIRASGKFGPDNTNNLH